MLRIATRRSALAMWQARHVAAALSRAHPQLEVEFLPMRTEGDRLHDKPLADFGGKGLFMKELELALAEGRAELAVHSLKDIPAELPPGMCLPAVLERADPRDAFVAHEAVSLDALELGARVGTSSLRRQCQLKAIRPDLELVALRGNVETRLGTLGPEGCAAVVLAVAGLERLGLAPRITTKLSPAVCLPAIGQGAIAIEACVEATPVLDLLAALEHAPTRSCITAERAFNARLGGDCHAPLAAYAELVEDTLWVRGLVGALDGTRILRDEVRGPVGSAAALGTELAERLLDAGAQALLDASK